VPRCYPHIVFARADRTYRLGEKITGHVELRADEDGACRKLVLTPVWRTHGWGVEDSAEAEGQVLQAVTYRRRQSTSYPFEIPTPAGPLSYAGRMFSIKWYLRAHADLRLALDAESEQEFTLFAPAAEATAPSFERPDYEPFYPGPSVHDKDGHPALFFAISFGFLLAAFPLLWPVISRHIIGGQSWRRVDLVEVVFPALLLAGALSFILRGVRHVIWRILRATARPRKPSGYEPGKNSPRPPGKYWEKTTQPGSLTAWLTGLLSILLALAGLFLLTTSDPAFRGEGVVRPQLPATYILIVAALLIGVGLYGTVRWLRPVLAKWKFGAVDVQVGSDSLHCGEEFSCTVQFRPPAAVHLAQASAKLEAIEVVHYRSGKKKQTETHLLHTTEITLAETRDLMVEESTLLGGSLQVPPEAPPTLVASSHKVLWFVTIKLMLRGWPDWTRSIPVVVRP
jgi:hypothetical protein